MNLMQEKCISVNQEMQVQVCGLYIAGAGIFCAGEMYICEAGAGV